MAHSFCRLARALALGLVISVIGAAGRADDAVITGVSVPVGSSDATSHPYDTGIWSVTASGDGLPVTSGIGYLVNPDLLAPLPPQNSVDFSLHDHGYVSPNVPDPLRAVVTYQFDAPTIVSALEFIQHTNGITQVEGFYGDAPGSLTSLGSVFGPSGDVTGWHTFAEGADQVFDFGNTTHAGTYFQFIIRKTSLGDGYASYRALPLDVDGRRIAPAGPVAVPEPGALVLACSGVACLLAARTRRGGRRRHTTG